MLTIDGHGVTDWTFIGAWYTGDFPFARKTFHPHYLTLNSIRGGRAAAAS